MTTAEFWRERFQELGAHSVGPGDTTSEEALEAHRQVFLDVIRPWLSQLRGPVLDFGCGVGRWTRDLPRPYLGLDLMPEHLALAQERCEGLTDVAFAEASTLPTLEAGSHASVFTCTVLQHVVDHVERRRILAELARILAPGGKALFVEWAERQKEYDWCTAVSRRELLEWFDVRDMGVVTEGGRDATVWWGTAWPPRMSALDRAWRWLGSRTGIGLRASGTRA